MAAQGDHLDRGQGARWSRRRGGPADHVRAGGRLTAADDVLDRFDRLPPAAVDDLVGQWRGSELPTGSPLDGLLAAYGWWGKEVVDVDTVHPLLVSGRKGEPYPVSPSLVPWALVARRPGLARTALVRRLGRAALPLARARRPGARLRMVTHRGVSSAALVYDALPIVDVFRRVSDDELVGLMDARGLHAPFAFLLHRHGRD